MLSICVFAGSTESFSHLCLLQGILSHADDHTLAFLLPKNEETIDLCSSANEHRIDDHSQSASFLLQLLHVIKRLCMSAKFKYHAFRLLELWLSRLKSVYRDSSSDLHFGSVKNDLLELSAGHTDCSVDGVAELIGNLLDSVLQLDKLFSQSTGEH